MIIDGKGIALQIQSEIQAEVAALKGRKPCLAVILVGENPPSKLYVSRKTQACANVGILSIGRHLPADISERQLIDTINEFNNNPDIDAILLQLPLPEHINTLHVLGEISPEKDVDGLNPHNLGKLLMGEKDGLVPCTPLGIQELLLRSGILIAGRRVVILGRSNLVGKPLAALLMQNAPGANATVTLAHSKSQNLKEICKSADILITAIGKPKFVTAGMVSDGSAIIDVGITKVGNLICGDVDFENVKDKYSFITPVPGGVGPMTIAMLLSNTLKCYRQRSLNNKI